MYKLNSVGRWFKIFFSIFPFILFAGVCFVTAGVLDINAGNSDFIEAAKEGENKRPLRIGLISPLSAVQMVKQWQPFMVYLSGEINMPVELVLKSNYEDVISGLANSEMDLALLGNFAYVQTYAQLKIMPVVTRVVFGSPYYHSVIIVRKDSHIDSAGELKGKSFAFTDRKSTTGYFLPYNMIRKNWGKPEVFFSNILFTGNHASALLAVQNGKVAGAGISTTLLNPTNPAMKDLKIIWKSEPIILGPFVVKKDMNPELVKRLRRAFLKFGKKETKDLARKMEVDGFVPVHDKDYNTIRNILKSFRPAGPGE